MALSLPTAHLPCSVNYTPAAARKKGWAPSKEDPQGCRAVKRQSAPEEGLRCPWKAQEGFQNKE